MNLFPSPLRFGWPASAAIAITCLLLWAAPAPAAPLDDARAYWERGELNAAGLVLKEHLRTEAEDAAARILLARVYLDLYQGDAALKELETAQRLGAPRARVLEPRARALLLTGAHQRVLDEVAVAAVADPAQRAVLAALRGDAERGLGNTDAALAEYERALELAPAQTDALLGKARLALAERRINDARELLVAATTANPEAARAWELLAEVDFTRGEHAAAEQSLVKAVIVGRNKWLPRFKRALTRIELGELQAAAADIDAVARIFPNFPGLSFARGALLLQQGELDAGLSALETYLKYDPNNLRALFLSAIGEAERGNLELASDLLTRYRKRLPDSVPASRALAEVLLRQRKPSAAEALLREALQARPDRPELLLTLAQALSRQGEWEAASTALLRVVDIQPDVADHRFAAAEYLHRIGQHDEALAQLEQALALDPLHRSAPLLRIKVLLELKRTEAALAHAETLIRARRNDPYALNAHGLAQLAQGDAAAARRSFRAALDAAPAFPDAALNLAKLSLREGDTGGARALLEDVVAAVSNHVEATLALAELDASAGDIRGQQRRLRAVLDAVPDEPRFLLALAQSYLRNGTPERARLLVQSAPERLRERAEMMLVLGQAQASVGDLDAALETFQALLLKTPESATPNFLLAALYAERKNRPAMEEALLEGATKAPDSPLLRSALAAGKTLYKDPALQLSLLDRLLTATDNAPRLVAAKADLLVEYGDHARAEQLMRGLLMRYPDDFGVLHKLVEIQLAGNAQPAAEEVLTAWLERHPDDATARVMLAQVQAELGRDAAARELLEELMASDRALASDPLLLNNLAWLLRETDPERALKYAERAYRDDPGSAAVKDTLGNLLVHAGELQRGLGLLEQAARAEPTNATIGFHYAEALAMAERDAEARVVLLNLLDKDFPERSAARALLERLGG